MTEAQIVDAGGAEAEGTRFTVGAERVVRSRLEPRFGNEDGIAGNLIALQPVLKVRPVNIGRVEVDAGRCRAISIQWSKDAEVIRPFLGLDLLAGDGHEHCVDVHA